MSIDLSALDRAVMYRAVGEFTDLMESGDVLGMGIVGLCMDRVAYAVAGLFAPEDMVEALRDLADEIEQGLLDEGDGEIPCPETEESDE